jgi:hypothetical protein
LESAILCANVCFSLENIAGKSKENTCLLISLGGGAAVAKVRAKWLNNEDVDRLVRGLVNTLTRVRLFSVVEAEMKAWVDEGLLSEKDISDATLGQIMGGLHSGECCIL